MLITGWLGNRISLHRSANNSVEYVSFWLSSDVSSVHITLTCECPEREFLSILVSLDDLYGMNLSALFSAREDMTLPRADREVLMNFASSRRC